MRQLLRPGAVSLHHMLLVLLFAAASPEPPPVIKKQADWGEPVATLCVTSQFDDPLSR